MIRSMTGGGRARRQINDFDVAVRFRAVNGKYLDLSVRLPSAFMDFEYALRQLCIERLGRGKIDLYIDIKDQRANSSSVEVNRSLINSMLDALSELHYREDIENKIDISTFLSIPGVLVIEPSELEDAEGFLAGLKEVVSEALSDLINMRLDEGAKLYVDLVGRLEKCVSAVKTMEKFAGEVQKEYLEKLRRRVNELANGLTIDSQRMEQEVALLVDRSDITEEIVRLRSHIGQMKKLLESDDVVGKKLDFLAQEMFREINTIGAKSKNAKLSKIVIDVKAEVEKIREQVQNVE